MDLWGLDWVLKGLAEYLPTLMSRELSNRELQAIKAFLTALSTTKIYYGTVESFSLNQDERRQRQEELSRLWEMAASAVQEFDGDLAMRCHTKSNYWADPKDWTADDLARLNVRIIQMEEEAHNILNRGVTKKGKRFRPKP